MPLREATETIKGADDYELGIPRRSPLVYHLTAPSSCRSAGLAFVIPSLGEDAGGASLVELRRHLAQAHGLMAVTVEYHCFRSRLSDGARLDISAEEFTELTNVCARHGIALLDRSFLLPVLHQLPIAYEFEVRIVPPRDDYQDLGFMQVLDHLSVLRNLMKQPEAFDTGNIMAMGGGYGGYLAHLLAKLAPNTVRAVFEHSAPVQAPRSYLFGGGGPWSAPYYYHIGKVRLFPRIATRWSADVGSERYFSPAREALRHLALPAHLATMRQSARTPCRFVMAHGEAEGSALLTAKRGHAEALTAAGFEAELEERPQAGSGGDGSGADFAPLLQAAFDATYAHLQPTSRRIDMALQSSCAYLCDDLVYSFEHGPWGCSPSITRIERRLSSRGLFY